MPTEQKRNTKSALKPLYHQAFAAWRGTKIREKEPFWKKISGNSDNEKTLKPLWNQRFLTGGSEWTRTTDTPGMNRML